jgi:hypothetical protein
MRQIGTTGKICIADVRELPVGRGESLGSARRQRATTSIGSARATMANTKYALRMYSLANAETPPNRISGYAFNPAGGLGSGAFFQDPVIPSERQAAMECLMLVVARVSWKTPDAATSIGYLQLRQMSRQRAQREEVLVVPSRARGQGRPRYEPGATTREQLAPISAGHSLWRRAPCSSPLVPAVDNHMGLSCSSCSSCRALWRH